MTALYVLNLRAAFGVFRRDWKVFRSYRTRLISHVLSSVAMLFMFHFTSRLVHVSMFRTREQYFGFVVVGIATLQVLSSTLAGPPGSVRQELVAGTFEQLVLSPFGAVLSIISMMIFPLLYTVATATITLAIAVVGFGLPLHVSTAAFALPVAVLGGLSFLPFGVLIAAATLTFKQATMATTYVIAAVSLLAGYYFPVSLLPRWIQWTSNVQPFTPSVDLQRHLLLGTALHQPVWLEVAKLAGFSAVLLPISAAALTAAVQFGRRRGTITEY